MKYTLIIPVYNGSATLHECLRAAISQENAILNKDYTVILVDDGSTDNTVEIASKFPISIIRLGSNKGRIIARLTGAQAAQTEKLLFVDSRVILSPNVISRADDFFHYPAVMGSYQARESKYRSYFDTVFFLIRRKYYGAKNFPQDQDLLYIDQKNFKRAPKGTTVLLINKNLFIDLIPDRTDKTVNDDTLLFQQLVFKKNIPLIRARKLLFEYIQRTDFNSFVPWLFERGVRFADFYLRPGGYFFNIFLTLLVSILSYIIVLFIIISTSNYHLIIYYLLFPVLLYVLINIWLSESLIDFIILLLIMPLIVIIFLFGIIYYNVIMIKKLIYKYI